MRLLPLYHGLVVALLSLAPLHGSTAILLAEVGSGNGYHTLPSEWATLEQEKALLVVSALYRNEGHETGTLPLELAALVAKYAAGDARKPLRKERLCQRLLESCTCAQCCCLCYLLFFSGGLAFFIYYFCSLTSIVSDHQCFLAYRS